MSIYVLMFLCTGACVESDQIGEVLVYFQTRASCDAVAKRYGEQTTNDGFAIESAEKGGFMVHGHDINPRKLHAECKELQLK